MTSQSSSLILGIETSCDETAAAVLRVDSTSCQNNRACKSIIESSVIFSQIDTHKAFGGVVPELAARAHVQMLDHVIKQAMDEAAIDFPDLDAIAVTAGPGLLGGVLVGLTSAKAIASCLKKPLYGINHLEGHALTPRLTDQTPYPYLLLLASGGHTQILGIFGLGDYRRYGSTIDDALGEAFDKTAKLLSLGFPGGPYVEKAAQKGDGNRFDLPRPILGRKGCDFSFAGLKTALRLCAEKHQPLSEQDISDLCAGFQHAVADILEDRLAHSVTRFQADCHDENITMDTISFVIAGGVAANQFLRQRLEHVSHHHAMELIAPPPALCTDNAAMIAYAGAERFLSTIPPDDDIQARPRWPLDHNAAPLYGTGKKGAKA